MDDEFRPGTNGLRVHYAERSLFNAFYPGYDAIFSFFTLFTPGFSNFSPNSHFFPCSYLILHNLYVWVDPKHLTPTICLSGYMMTMNADVSNKPATKNLHLTDGQDSYIKVRQLIDGTNHRLYMKGVGRVAPDTDLAEYPANIFTGYPVSGRISG